LSRLLLDGDVHAGGWPNVRGDVRLGRKVVGYRANDGVGYYPSDLHGLHTMLDLVREPEDPTVALQDLWHDLRVSAEHRVYVAIGIARESAPHRSGRLDVLACVHRDVREYADEVFQGRVVIGTPLWIAEQGVRTTSE